MICNNGTMDANGLESRESPSVDRPARDALAEIILAAAQGNEPPEAYDARPPLLDTADYGVKAFAFVPDLIFYDIVPDRRGDVETWRWLQRVVALLRSDLPLVQVQRSMRHPRQFVGLGGALLIIAGIVAAIALGAWWPLFAAWAVAGVGMVLFMRHYPHLISAEVEELGRFAPFRSEAQWNRYRNLVGPDELPHQNDTTPAETGDRFSVLWVLFGALFGTLLLPAMLRASHFNVELVESEDL